MDKIYYARKEEIIKGRNKLALYEKEPLGEDESRITDWPIDYDYWLRNTDIEIPTSAKVRIRIELVD